MSLNRPLTDAEQRALLAKQARGIGGSLLLGLPVEGIFGDSDDFYLALNKHFVRSPKDIRVLRKNLLGPVSLVSRDGKTNDDLFNVIEEFYKSPDLAGKDYELYIPSCNDKHWQVTKVTVEGGEIVRTGLYDPLDLSEEDLESTPEFQTVQRAVEVLRGDAKAVTRPEPAGVQTNGFSCMDYCVQKIAKDVAQDDASLQAIATAKSAAALRSALANKLRQELLIERPAPVAAPSAPKEEQSLVDVEKLHKHLMQEREAQVKFDEEMARQLSVLFKTNANHSDDAILFEQARDKACHKLLPKAGFFSSTARKPAAPAPDMPAPRSTHRVK